MRGERTNVIERSHEPRRRAAVVPMLIYKVRHYTGTCCLRGEIVMDAEGVIIEGKITAFICGECLLDAKDLLSDSIDMPTGGGDKA